MNRLKTYTVRGQECVPVDRVAARVVGGSTDDPCEHITTAEFGKEPPRIFHWHGPIHLDLTGETNGAVTIIGYGGGKRNKNTGSLWIGRCACGMYVRRRSTTWRRSATRDMGCQRCRKNDYRRTRAAEIDAGVIPSWI